ncbi:MAG TPA: nucleotidyltransferase family protein, partial [Tahibacter sp.]|nr:nucleotidyltransferase family protein [Tahibacter sp.]
MIPDLSRPATDDDVVWRPRVTVATIVPRDDRYLLVEEEIRGRLLLNQPAGHLEPGESLLEAARRETREETGWDVTLDCLVGIHQWVNPELDRHWRTASVKGLLAEPDLTRDLRIVTVGNHRLPTLGDEALMVYLAVHGARHGWSRLKWLADFNALLAARDEAAVAALRARAKRDGVMRAMDLALLQANRLFGTSVPDDVGRSRRVRWLAALSDALMRGPDELAEQHMAPRRYMAVGHASALLLKSSPAYLANAAWSSWVSTADALALPLPPAARPLYLLTSPAARIARATRRIVDRGFSRTARSP